MKKMILKVCLVRIDRFNFPVQFLAAQHFDYLGSSELGVEDLLALHRDLLRAPKIEGIEKPYGAVFKFVTAEDNA